MYRNGKPLPRIDQRPLPDRHRLDEPALPLVRSKVGDEVFMTSSSRLSFDPMPVHVPPGHIYVLGDHRDSSNDSRNPAVGAIPINRVKGRALSIYWSSGEDGLRWSRMMHNVQ